MEMDRLESEMTYDGIPIEPHDPFQSIRPWLQQFVSDEFLKES